MAGVADDRKCDIWPLNESCAFEIFKILFITGVHELGVSSIQQTIGLIEDGIWKIRVLRVVKVNWTRLIFFDLLSSWYHVLESLR